MNMRNISLNYMIRRFWKPASLTWMLVLLESVSLVIMPLVIGWAVDDLVIHRPDGTVKLILICLILLIAGSARRFYDTRIYARIYCTVANELVDIEQKKNTGLSKITARTNLFSEFIYFLENSVPEILQQLISLFGTLIVIVFVDISIFFICLVGTLCTILIYGISEKRIFRLNTGLNDEIEKQVDILGTEDRSKIQVHFSRLMKWRIKLSDLETINFSLIWIVLAAVLVFTVVTISVSGKATSGQIVSTVMYVFVYIENVMEFPLYYQQIIRLKEISKRISKMDHQNN